MSFRCQKCNVAQPHGAKPAVKPVGFRQRFYPPQRPSRANNWNGGREGRGYEILGQVVLCQACSNEWTMYD